jgi:predicted RNA-binding Zn-ribbon protein involved in translation (DUF1610 family)
MWRIRTTDDAGQTVVLRRFGVMPWRASGRRRHWLLRLALTPTGLMSLLVLTVAGAVVAIAFNSGPIIIALLLFSPGAATLSLMFVMLAKTWEGVLLGRPERVKRSWLRERICPSCGYDLEGLDPDDAGKVACPECGATWIRDPKEPPRRVVIRDWARATPRSVPTPTTGGDSSTPPGV